MSIVAESMSDPIVWFLGKHWLVSAFLLPEVSLAFAVWQRWFWWAGLLGGYVIALRAAKFLSFVLEFFRGD